MGWGQEEQEFKVVVKSHSANPDYTETVSKQKGLGFGIKGPGWSALGKITGYLGLSLFPRGPKGRDSEGRGAEQASGLSNASWMSKWKNQAGQRHEGRMPLPFVQHWHLSCLALFVRCRAVWSAAMIYGQHRAVIPPLALPQPSQHRGTKYPTRLGMFGCWCTRNEGCVSLSIYFFQTMINSGTNGSRINCENATIVCRYELCGSDVV